MAHCLELAVRDALKATVFDMVDDLLQKLYYLYKTSPKKSRELEDIVSDLKENLNLTLTTMDSNQFMRADPDGLHT